MLLEKNRFLKKQRMVNLPINSKTTLENKQNETVEKLRQIQAIQQDLINLTNELKSFIYIALILLIIISAFLLGIVLRELGV